MRVLLFFSLIIALNASEFVGITWNKTEEVINEIIYSQFSQENSFCDLTVGICDSWCCIDKDCTETQKKAFECDIEVSKPIDMLFSCNSNNQPSWMSFFCYTKENSPYLGMFYPHIDVIEKPEQLKKIFQRQLNKEKPTIRPYKYRDGIMMILNEDDKKMFPLMFNTLLSSRSKSCVSSVVKYYENYTAECEKYLTEFSCKNDDMLSIYSYLIKSNISVDAPIIVGNILTVGLIVANVSVFDKTNGNLVQNFENIDTKLNSKLNICENVLSVASFEFLVDGSVIKHLSVYFELSSMRFGRILQNFSVSFRDSRPVWTSNRVGFYKRGYLMGQRLKSGFLRKNLTTVWEPGRLRVFQNGGNCRTYVPVTFGFSSASSCRLDLPNSNCPDSRIQLEAELNDLFTGEFVSQYRTLTAPYLDSVPILRKTDNATCRMPQSINLVVLFSPLPIDGRFTYRILGANISISYRNFTSGSMFLTSSVRFIQIPSHNPVRLSRFWAKIFSREESLFAWLNIFNAFDYGLTGDETQEISFWVFLFFISFITFLVLAGGSL